MRTHSHAHNHTSSTMKAVEWEGKPFSVTVKSVPIPTIKNKTDAIIRVTSAGICGSDLHYFHGRNNASVPLTLGHEIVGIVDSIGSDVSLLNVGDRVIVNLEINETTLDGRLETIGAVGIGGLPGLEELNGGQAEFIRVPFASDNCIVLPKGTEHELDYVLLADIFPTSNFALDSAGFQFGDVVAVFGAGPLGLLTVYSAFLRGASKVYSIDRVPQRLAKAKSIGAIPIDFSSGDPVKQIMAFEPQGVDCSCDCVGYERVNAEGVNVENLVISQAVNLTKAGGGIGLIGVYLTSDEAAPTSAEKKGILKVPLDLIRMKSLSIKGGIVPLRQYQPQLQKLIESGRAKPSFVFDREFRLEDAASAYTQFSNLDFIRCVLRVDESILSGVVVEDVDDEKATPPKKRTRNGGHKN